jgi:cell division septum initiation protein DivIVA
LAEAGPGPSLAELKRRATARRRELGRFLAAVEREYRAAAEECERLRAARPESLPNAPASDHERPSREPADGDEREGARLRIAALQQALRQAEQTLAAAQARNRQLEEEVAALEAQRVLADERPDQGTTGKPALWRARVAALEDELKRAELDRDCLREDMLNLLSFLEKLTSILSGDGAQAPSRRGRSAQ